MSFEPSMGWLKRRAAEAEEHQARHRLAGPFTQDKQEPTKTKAPGLSAQPRPMMPAKPPSPFIDMPPGEEDMGLGGMPMMPPSMDPNMFLDDPGMMQMPGLNGPGRNQPGGGGIGQSPMMDRQRMPSGDPSGPKRQGPVMKSPQGLPSAKPPSSSGPSKSGPGKSPSGPSKGPGGGGSSQPAMSLRQAMNYLADIPGMGQPPGLQVPPIGAPPPSAPQGPPQGQPAAPPSPSMGPTPSSMTSGSPGVQTQSFDDGGGLYRQSESDWGNHPLLGDPSISKRRGGFSRLRLR